MRSFSYLFKYVICDVKTIYLIDHIILVNCRKHFGSNKHFIFYNFI